MDVKKNKAVYTTARVAYGGQRTPEVVMGFG